MTQTCIAARGHLKHANAAAGSARFAAENGQVPRALLKIAEAERFLAAAKAHLLAEQAGETSVPNLTAEMAAAESSRTL